jgi:hypothetical protein
VISSRPPTEIAAAEEADSRTAAAKSQIFAGQFTGKGTIKTSAQWWSEEKAAGVAEGMSGSPAIEVRMSEPYETGGQRWRKIIAPMASNMDGQKLAFVLDADVDGFVADAVPTETAARQGAYLLPRWRLKRRSGLGQSRALLTRRIQLIPRARYYSASSLGASPW